MQPLKSYEIRQRFLDFFKKKNHQVIQGSSIVPQHDPSLLFINSGMAPLKKYFLGEATPPNKRLANVQPCIRTKDIDDVGDRHHLTMFEMLGSWSIGDYYKKEAVQFAYAFLVDELKFDPKRLLVTVYKGDKKLGLAEDEVSAKAWEDAGIAKERILFLGADNFWGPAGETGPCGPCTEVFFDFGPDFGDEYKPGQDFDTTSRYIEIWNAGVFMELNKLADGSFEPLAIKSVDTGSGLERMCMAMNNTQTVYETDLFEPLMQTAQKIFAKKPLSLASKRMLSDHMRAATLMLAEGVVPSNEGRGYIPRRLLRRAISICVAEKVKSESLVQLVDVTVKLLGEVYPVLTKKHAHIQQNVLKEIKDFEPTIAQGLKLLNEKLQNSVETNSLSGDDIFTAVATHGVPIEVVKKFASDNNLNADINGFEKKFTEHQEISRSGGKNKSTGKDSPALKKIATFLQQNPVGETSFNGYGSLNATSSIVALFSHRGAISTEAGTGEKVFFVTDSTCFYGEGGGQVGDKGTASTKDSELTISDTIKLGDTFIHIAAILSGTIKTKDQIELRVNSDKRLRTRRNHSATHLLHSALRETLGDHVTQKGSHVDDKRLRFDFQHPQAVTTMQLAKVEQLVNQWIWDNSPTQATFKSYDDAIAAGALALFSEKYGDKVRVIEFGNNSTELCGGTHVEATGEIGSFVITSESSVARGVRRIEALTSENAYLYNVDKRHIVSSLEKNLNVKSDKVLERVEQIKNARNKNNEPKPDLASAATEKINLQKAGCDIVLCYMNTDPANMKVLAERHLQENKTAAVVVSTEAQRVRILVMSEKALSKAIPAQEILKKILAGIEGKGGGKPTFAQGGGIMPSSIKELKMLIMQVLNGY